MEKGIIDLKESPQTEYRIGQLYKGFRGIYAMGATCECIPIAQVGDKCFILTEPGGYPREFHKWEREGEVFKTYHYALVYLTDAKWAFRILPRK